MFRPPVGSGRGDEDESGRRRHSSRVKFLSLAWAGMPKTSFRKNSDSPHDGLQEGKLKPCPDSPNCISSEQGMIEPVVFSKGDAQPAWIKLQQVIVSQGGQIESLQSDYLRALFSTSWMGLKDDVEARLDVPMHRIQLRSASRVGYYDFGANRKRLNNIVRLMRMSLDPEALKNIYQ